MEMNNLWQLFYSPKHHAENPASIFLTSQGKINGRIVPVTHPCPYEDHARSCWDNSDLTYVGNAFNPDTKINSSSKIDNVLSNSDSITEAGKEIAQEMGIPPTYKALYAEAMKNVREAKLDLYYAPIENAPPAYIFKTVDGKIVPASTYHFSGEYVGLILSIGFVPVGTAEPAAGSLLSRNGSITESGRKTAAEMGIEPTDEALRSKAMENLPLEAKKKMSLRLFFSPTASKVSEEWSSVTNTFGVYEKPGQDILPYTFIGNELTEEMRAQHPDIRDVGSATGGVTVALGNDEELTAYARQTVESLGIIPTVKMVKGKALMNVGCIPEPAHA